MIGIILSSCKSFTPMTTPLSGSSNPSAATQLSSTFTVASTQTSQVLIHPSVTPSKWPSPQVTKIILDTPYEKVYFWDWVGYYGYLNPQEGIPLIPHFVNPQTEDAKGPSDAFDLSFSRYTQQIAYLTNLNGVELWIADQQLTKVEQVWSDGEEWLSNPDAYEQGDIYWGPNDMSIFIKRADRIVVYSLKERRAFQWAGRCNTLAQIPGTDELGIWCILRNGNTLKYGVVGNYGTILEFSSAPTNLISNIIEWAYSPDGDRVLYATDQGDVGIVDTKGEYISLSVVFSPVTSPLMTRRGLQWSQDGSQLLVYGYDGGADMCYKSPSLGDMPCWLLIDAWAGDILWAPPREASSSFDAALSSNGEWLAINIWAPRDQRTIVVSIKTGKIINIWDATLHLLNWAK